MAEPPTPPPSSMFASNGGSRPIPDPTERTTEALLAAIAALRELVFSRIDGDKEAFQTRLAGMDEAIRLVRKESDGWPKHIDEKVSHLDALTGVKFEGIQQQFKERDVRTEQTARDAKTAVDAALQAQKEQAGKSAETFDRATQKSEDQFVKQIDGLRILIDTSIKGLDDKISDLKDRFNRGEGKGEGQVVAQHTQQTSNSFLLAIIGFAVGTGLGVIGIVMALAQP